MQPSDRAALCLAMGCKVLYAGHVEFMGTSYPVWKIFARSNDHLVEVFNGLAALTAREDPNVRSISAQYTARADHGGLKGVARERYIAERIQQYVRETTKFQREEQETSRPPDMTFALGAGDCDEQASLVASLAWAAGLSACVVGLRDDEGEITHVCSQIEVNGVPTWVETTVDAAFGEEPRAAVARLGLAERRDVVG